MRRWFGLLAIVVVLGFTCAASVAAAQADTMRVATFRCDITPPLGQPMFCTDPLRTVDQPLLAKGIVIEAGGQRNVLCALDWCELCNGSYDALRKQVAAAAGTEPDRVALQCVHPHTAPYVDRDAQKLLTEVGGRSWQIEPAVFDAIAGRLTTAVKESLARLEPFDRIGTGQAKVDRVAANRRPKDDQGKIRVRSSTTKSAEVRALPEGTIDPYLKTITLARGEKPLVRLHYYASHPQTRYGDNRASSDMVGDARETMERKEGVFQVYFTGCGGDITVGKYNDGAPARRKELAGRLLAGIEASVAATTYRPAGAFRWRTYSLLLPARSDAGFTEADALAYMRDAKNAPVFRLYKGAGCAAFHQRSQRPIELSSLQLGDVWIVHLPGEPMVCYQFFAQGLRPQAFVAVAGYGDGGPGYLCPAAAYKEGGYEPTATRIKPESEPLVKQAIAALLGVESYK
jgi:hypothetical protein